MGRNDDLWREYRAAFREFAHKVQKMQSLNASASLNRSSIESSLFELALVEAERARLYYNQCRDALASSLLARSLYALPPKTSALSEFQRVERVKVIANLLWEFEDRREGRAEEDWYRAERIVRKALGVGPAEIFENDRSDCPNTIHAAAYAGSH